MIKGGFLTKEASRLTGLEENIPVAVGSGDGITTIFGLGAYADGQAGITVGSAGIIATTSKLFPEDEKQRSYVFCHPFCDRWYSFMATASSGEIFRWYNKSIIKNDRISYSDLDKEASECPAGADGLIFLPYLLGSRNPHSNPNACGMMLGLRYKHERKHLTRAILEGICFELMDILKVQEDILSKNKIKIKGYKAFRRYLPKQFLDTAAGRYFADRSYHKQSKRIGCFRLFNNGGNSIRRI